MATPARKRRARKPEKASRPKASDEHLERCARNTEELRQWAADYGVGACTYLANRAGLTFAAVARILKGTAQPNPESARRLSLATDGDCSAARMLGIESSTLATVSRSARAVHAKRAS